MVIIMTSSRNLYPSILYHQSPRAWPRVAQAGAPGSISYLGLGVAYVVADLQIGFLGFSCSCRGAGFLRPLSAQSSDLGTRLPFSSPSSPSSRAERPDFLFRAAFWRVGSHSRGIPLRRKPKKREIPHSADSVRNDGMGHASLKNENFGAPTYFRYVTITITYPPPVFRKCGNDWTYGKVGRKCGNDWT